MSVPLVVLIEGPDWVRRKDGGWARALRVEIDGELALDTDQFSSTWDAISYCVANFGKNGYLYVCL